MVREIDFRKYNFSYICSRLLASETQSWNLLRIYLTEFSLLHYQFSFNRNGIQLALNLEMFTEIFSSCFVKFCNVQGEAVDFVNGKGTMLLTVVNNW